MSQTTGNMTFRNAKVELSSDGSTWTDVSGSVSAVTVSGGERQVIEFQPLFSDTTKAQFGSRERVLVAVNSVYTEVAAEVFTLLDTAYLANSALCLRWTPAGGDSLGVKRYKTVNAKVKSPAYPGGDVSEAKPLMVEYELSAEYIDKETT